MIRIALAALAGVFLSLTAPLPTHAQQTDGPDLQSILQDNSELVANASRRTVQEVLDILVDSRLPEVPAFLTAWQALRSTSAKATVFSSTWRTPTPMP